MQGKNVESGLRVRKLRFFFILLLAGGFALLDLPHLSTNGAQWPSIGVPSALAQQAQKKKRRSLLSILFGRKEAKKKTVVKKSKRSTQRSTKKRRAKNSKSKTRRTSGGVTTLASKKKTVEKSEDAKVILVVGDFFAGGLADGLTASFSDIATLRVIDKSKGLSGFVRDDVIDWPAQLPLIVEETKPAYIVAMLGSNDRQLMREGGKKLKKRTPEWDAAYKKRVEALGTALKATGVTYNLVGLPPVRFKSMNKDFLIFNELYGKAAASPNGKFIDVWDGFSDAEGNYSRSGPDVNGQIVLLRPKDGINLTKAGRQRLTYYVEGLITKKLGGRDEILADQTGVELVNALPKPAEYDPAKTGKTIVVRLDDPSADGGETLAGEKIEISPAAIPAVSIPLGGVTSIPTFQQGRVDNFTWPPANGAQPSSPAVAATSN